MTQNFSSLPYVTSDLEGIGGTVRASPEDFEVEEIPAYSPSGEGSHLFLWVEKRGRNTRDVVREIARAIGVSDRELGVAGLKDKNALTRQYVSVPASGALAKTNPENLVGPGWKVLKATLHQNKLKTGHLRGNRFTIKIRECNADLSESEKKARAIAVALQQRGLPNAFGPQRFGKNGSNASLGRALLLALETKEAKQARRDRFLRRLAVSAYQSLLFNLFLSKRLEDGFFAKAIDGDLMKKLDTGGLFISKDTTEDTARIERFELSPTGPMFGHKMMQPEAKALERENEILASQGLTLASFAPMKADGEGTRRPLRIPLSIEVNTDDSAVALQFDLPKGSYATIVLREIMKKELGDNIPDDSAQ